MAMTKLGREKKFPTEGLALAEAMSQNPGKRVQKMVNRTRCEGSREVKRRGKRVESLEAQRFGLGSKGLQSTLSL